MRLLRASIATRLVGFWMMLIAVAAPLVYVGLVVANAEDWDIAIFVAVGLLAAWMGWVGFRTVRMGVWVDGDSLLCEIRSASIGSP